MVMTLVFPIPREQRHEWLRFDTEGYTKEEQQEYKRRLAKIYYRKIHRVHVLDFAWLSEINEGDAELDMTGRLRMEHMGDDGLTNRAAGGPLEASQAAGRPFQAAPFSWTLTKLIF
ncbi:hypothetical protein Tco_0416960 [Tanacetum coccineum]